MANAGRQPGFIANAIGAAAVFVCAATPAFAQDEEPRLRTVEEVSRESLRAVPDKDPSWITLRLVLGPDLWDSSAELLHDMVLKATLPGNFSGANLIADVPSVDLGLVPGGAAPADRGAPEGRSIADVLGGITRLIQEDLVAEAVTRDIVAMDAEQALNGAVTTGICVALANSGYYAAGGSHAGTSKCPIANCCNTKEFSPYSISSKLECVPGTESGEPA